MGGMETIPRSQEMICHETMCSLCHKIEGNLRIIKEGEMPASVCFDLLVEIVEYLQAEIVELEGGIPDA